MPCIPSSFQGTNADSRLSSAAVVKRTMLCHDVSMAKFGALWLAAAGVSAFAAAAQRPPIVGIANIALKVRDSLLHSDA